MKTKEINELIAKFLGWKLIKPKVYKHSTTRTHSYWEYKHKGSIKAYNYLSFHKDWNMLMLVIHAIQYLPEIGDFSIGSSYACIEHVNNKDEWSINFYEHEDPLINTHELIGIFLTWYNKSKDILPTIG